MIFSEKFNSYFIANKLKYKPGWFGVIYNLLFSIKGRVILYVYYVSNFDDLISFFFRRRLKRNYHFEVGKKASLGYGLVLNHPYNIIIDSGVVLGDNCQIDQNVTIGGNMRKYKMRDEVEITRPTIGNNVILCAGCLVAGPINIGSDSIIGANATVTFDVPENCIVSNTTKILSKRIKVENGTYSIID